MTPSDRTLRSAADLADLGYRADDGLLPVIAQHADTGEVLMLAWANREALTRTLESGRMHYWSRSRGELWTKGATSGNVQRLRSLHADCDGDTVLALVVPAGPACHTGDPTCFGKGSTPSRGALATLWEVLASRNRERPEGSYTTRLLGDENLRLKKLGEEHVELLAAVVRGERERIPEEAADLIYHLLVVLLAAGTSLDEVLRILSERRAPQRVGPDDSQATAR